MDIPATMFLAKALYDNLAETQDELSFRRGDVVTVLSQDTGGLVGWWLCRLRSRQGVAPANRLKILSAVTASGGHTVTTPGSRVAGQHQHTPSHKVQTPVKRGDVYLYHTPQPSMEDYDVPPSRYFPSSREVSPEAPGHDVYDTPAKPATPISSSLSPHRPVSSQSTPPGSKRASVDSASPGSCLSHTLPRVGVEPSSTERRLADDQPIYDTPPSKAPNLTEPLDEVTYDTPLSRAPSLEPPGELTYDTPSPSTSSTRPSRDCTASTGRPALSPRHHASTNPSHSARCSLSVTDHHDPLCRESGIPQQLSVDSGLAVYDTPVSGRRQSTSLQPPSRTCLSQLNRSAEGEQPCVDIRRSRSFDYPLNELYDCPRSNTRGLLSGVPSGSAPAIGPGPSAVYDIPPQVTQDSITSLPSASPGESQRSSSRYSVDYGSASNASPAGDVCDELLLDVDNALKLLGKRQQDVTSTASRLLEFQSPTWRCKESLQTQVHEIRTVCGQLKKAVGDFTELAQGALANAVRSSDRRVVDSLAEQTIALQQLRHRLGEALHGVEDVRWQVDVLADPGAGDGQDDLATIMTLARDVGPSVHKLAWLIRNSGSLVSQHVAARTRSPVDTHTSAHQWPQPGAGGGSGVGVVIQRPRSIQQRPLPAPPVPLSGRPLPPIPLSLKRRDLELAAGLRQLDDRINVDGDPRSNVAADGEDGDRDYSDLQQEYDYVQLDSPRAIEGQQQTDDLGQQPATPLEEKMEVPDAPTPQSFQCQDGTGQECDTVQAGTDVIHHLSTDVGAQDMNLNGESTQDNKPCVLPAYSDIFDELLSNEPDSAEEPNTPVNAAKGFHIPENLHVDLSSTSLSASDKQVLVYYSAQMDTHSTLLTNAMDTFFSSIEHNAPPKVFISNSKFVLVTAHKLVFMSDSMHRSLVSGEVRHKVMHCTTGLCHSLALTVQATRTAALQYPSLPALQDMVDRVVHVAHTAHELQLVITQAAAL